MQQPNLHMNSQLSLQHPRRQLLLPPSRSWRCARQQRQRSATHPHPHLALTCRFPPVFPPQAQLAAAKKEHEQSAQAAAAAASAAAATIQQLEVCAAAAAAARCTHHPHSWPTLLLAPSSRTQAQHAAAKNEHEQSVQAAAAAASTAAATIQQLEVRTAAAAAVPPPHSTPTQFCPATHRAPVVSTAPPACRPGVAPPPTPPHPAPLLSSTAHPHLCMPTHTWTCAMPRRAQTPACAGKSARSRARTTPRSPRCSSYRCGRLRASGQREVPRE